MRRLGLIAAIVILALLAGGGYAAVAGAAVYQDLDGGRQALVGAQASMTAGARTGDPAELQSAAAQLKLAERHFNDARARSSTDPALRLVGGLPNAGRQLAASTHLAAIGADMSRAGEGAAEVAIQVAGLKQKYATRALTPDDLQAALQEAQAIAGTYGASIQAISQQLRAAHAERAQVDTTELVGPLKDAYDAVDRALAEADTSFRRYQDVRQVLSDFLGVPLPP
jgi:multidrug resistance efflux pump